MLHFYPVIVESAGVTLMQAFFLILLKVCSMRALRKKAHHARNTKIVNPYILPFMMFSNDDYIFLYQCIDESFFVQS
jgi:hypothetical protein